MTLVPGAPLLPVWFGRETEHVVGLVWEHVPARAIVGSVDEEAGGGV